MAIQDDNTILKKADLKAYHERIAPMLGGTFMVSTNNSDYYSTDEKVVGVWTDGKPLYQRSFDIGTESSTGVKNYTLNVANVDYAMLDFSHSFLYSKSGSTVTETLPLMIVWDTVSSGGYTLVPQTSSVRLQWYREAWQNLPAIVTIQYTKTTDAAGSALTTPGAYDINFPNTWPANKEIYFGNGMYGYRATGNFTATATGREFHKDMPTIPTTSRLVSSGGNFTVGGYSDFNMGLGPVYSSTQLVMSSCLFLNNGGIPRFRVMPYQYALTTSDTYDVWLKYTK